MDIKNLTNKEIIGLLKENDFSMRGVERKYGLTKTTIPRLLQKRGIDYNKELDIYKKEKIEEYNKTPKLCKYCGKPIPWEKRNSNCFCSSSCAASYNNKGKVKNPKGIGLTGGRKAKKTNKSIVTKTKLCPICGEENCCNDFCKEHNIQQLNGLVKHIGLDETSIGTTRIFSEFNRVRSLVYNLYWDQGCSRQDLGKRFNYSYSTMPTNVLTKTLNIPTRSLSEAVSNAILHEKLTVPETNKETGLAKNICQEWHTTWTGDNVFLRSSYEIDYANYLDENQISYSVEDLRIEYYDSQQDKTRVAIPDFYLSSTNEIVEIKSDFTLDIQEMRDKFEAYKKLGYKPKLILEKKEVDLENLQNLIDKKRYNKILDKNIFHFQNK